MHRVLLLASFLFGVEYHLIMAQMASERELKPAEKPELSPGEYLPLRVMAFPEEASESAPTLCTEHERTAPSLMVARQSAFV